ncbi:MAG: lipoprotein signal peptidase [Acinetobacter sp.]|nr:MAG: lipoprotein signal peptidase [Acinetobacter sp.]
MPKSTTNWLRIYPHNLLWLGLAVLAIVLDQISKKIALNHILHNNLPCPNQVQQICAYSESIPVIPPVLDWTLAYNYGAAFSFLSGAGGWQHFFFTGLAGIVSLFFIFWLLRMPKSLKVLPLAICLILAGALGNFIDRMTLGYVVDFIHVHYQQSWHFPIFNIADCAITLGTILLLIDSFFLEKKRHQPKAEQVHD